jgi:Fe-S oxidoreductase
MRVGLFVPCYVDAFFPEVGISTLEILERCGLDVGYPLDQTCCGQPMANAGSQKDAAGAEALFVENFRWSQPVDATLALNLSAGVSIPKALRVRSLS